MLFAVALAYPGGMGMGDVKMGGMLGAFLGPYAALTVFLGAVVGCVVGGLLLATGRIQRRSPLPFGAFLAGAGVFTLFLGREVWGSYLRLAGGA
jgi:leader peptidase (prepilin peptidase)/N-methyltransferase